MYSRAKIKKSCQDLGLYKMKSISKKQLKDANNKLKNKLKSKVEGKTELARRAKNAEESAQYWENQHAKIKEELEGKSSISYTYTTHYSSCPDNSVCCLLCN